MRYLLDTKAISVLRQKHRADRNAVDWFEAAAGDEFFVSALSLMEIEIGVRRLEPGTLFRARRFAPGRTGSLQSGSRIAGFPSISKLPSDVAALHVPDPRPAVDALIAASAIVKGLTLVTRNERDFARMPVAVVNPWSVPDR